MSKYTTDDLLKYLYKEYTDEESKAISDALIEDWNLRDEYNFLKESMQHLNSMIKQPRQESINAILKYAGTSAEVAQ